MLMDQRACAGHSEEPTLEMMRMYQTIHADHEVRSSVWRV